MNSRDSVKNELLNYPEKALIFTGNLYRNCFCNQMTETAFSQIMSRLCKNGDVVRISKGIYCRPKKTRFGLTVPSDKEISEYYLCDNKGVAVGYNLYNSLGVSTQVSKRIEVFSSESDETLKQIRNITVYRYVLEYSNEVKSLIYLLELLYHFKTIEDINYSAYYRALKEFSKNYSDEAFFKIQAEIHYPKWTVAFLREVLDFYGIKNNLSKYLSDLSKYDVPEMEELYELAS